MAEQQDIGRLMEYSLSRVAVGQASRLSPTSKHFSSSHTVFVIQKIFRKMKAVKLETGATPFLRGELRGGASVLASRPRRGRSEKRRRLVNSLAPAKCVTTKSNFGLTAGSFS